MTLPEKAMCFTCTAAAVSLMGLSPLTCSAQHKKVFLQSTGVNPVIDNGVIFQMRISACAV